MKNTYTVQEALAILKQYHITSHEESIRRWLREGQIKGQRGSRKKGWVIPQEELWNFIRGRVPSHVIPENNTTNVELKDPDQIKESAREEMWWVLVHKHIFEDALIIKI